MAEHKPMDIPPQGPPWDLPLEQAPLAFVDVEATGLDTARDRVVEICIARVQGLREIAGLETLVHPQDRAGGASHIHGLSAEALAGAPPFSAIAPRVRELLDGAVFVAHGSCWDVMYIEAEMRRAGVEVSVPFHLDTVVLARRAFGLPSNKLGTLAQALGVNHDRAHRAGSDVAALRGIFGRIAEVLQASSPRDLWHVRVGQGVARPEIVAACEAAVGCSVLLRYRPSGRAPEHFAFLIASVRTDLDPPRVIGYLLPGRGHRELRSDRILAVELISD